MDWDDVLLIMGDINIDLLPHYHATRPVQYKNMLNCFNLHQHVQRPTRVNRHRYLRLTIQGNMTIIDQLLYPTYPCSPFYLHSILILAPVLSQNRNECKWCILSAAVCKNESGDLHAIGGYTLDSLIGLA